LSHYFASRIPSYVSDDVCWIWTGPTADDGTPCMKSCGHRLSARMFIWLLEDRPLDDSRILLPTCGTKLCVNPAHLAAVRLVDLGPDD